MSGRALAIAAHPDDIEFLMAGTLLLLRAAGWELHYLNISSGNLGSLSMSAAETARVRRREARAGARVLRAVWHPPICHDLQIFYDNRTLRRLCAIVRTVRPSVILTHSPQDYMEDHMNTSRLAVTAAFARGAKNYRTTPSRASTLAPVTIYHAVPHGLHDQLGHMIVPDVYVDTASVQATKREALARHASQRDFLNQTQGFDSYLAAMDGFSRELGRMSQKFEYAEGWRRHSHLGFCAEDADPLKDALRECVAIRDSR
jgi:LmbE family N-acetylglucosaminyl deacetylase